MENVLLVGSGGREHAIAKALVRHGGVRLFAAAAYANPGIAALAEDVLATETDAERIVAFCAEHDVSFCAIGPEAPLEAGLSDTLEAAGYPCAAPSRAAARIETSKPFMRALLDRHEIPGRIRYVRTTDAGEAERFAEDLGWRVAVKPVGLTGGKGVRVWGDHFSSPGEVSAYVAEVLASGDGIVVEELLEGQELTLHFYCDGRSAHPSPLIQDHKRAYDGDAGPNTGGMGAYSWPDGLLPFVTPEEYDAAADVGRRVVAALAAEGTPFRGVLYGQFMVTSDGPKVIEFNARFGDPEAINALALLETPYADVCRAMIDGTLGERPPAFRPRATVVLYAVPTGYGTAPVTGAKVVVDEHAVEAAGGEVFWASCDLVERHDGVAVVTTTTSRTLAVYAEGETAREARTSAVAALRTVEGDVTFRSDIGSEESVAAKSAQMSRLRGG